MSRYRREAELAALYGDRYPAVVVSQMGSRKRDRKKLLSDQLQERFQYEPQPAIGGYAEGTLPSPSYAQMLDELLMGPAMDEAASPDLEPFVKAGRPDQALHAAFFGNLAKGLGGGRLGAEASNIAGFAREGLQGLGSAVTGGKFFSPGGFDTGDIRANMFGIDRATKSRTR